MSRSEAKEEMSVNSTNFSNLVNQAAAVANLALIMAQCERNEGLALLEDATSRLPTAQKLLERSASQLSINPLSTKSSVGKEFFTLDDLCSGKTHSVRIADDVEWVPFAKDSGKFRNLLLACASAAIKAQTEKWDGYVAKILCNIAIEPPTDPEEIDSNELELDRVLQTQGDSIVKILGSGVGELLKIARNKLPKMGERNSEWAHSIINNWRQTQAFHFRDSWLREARHPGLTRDFVIWLVEQRKQKNKNKGRARNGPRGRPS
jgi:hypothetical protein